MNYIFFEKNKKKRIRTIISKISSISKLYSQKKNLNNYISKRMKIQL